MQPLRPAEGTGLEQGWPSGLQDGEREPGFAPVSVVVRGEAGGRGPSLLPLGPGLPQHSSVQVSVAWLGPQLPVRVVGHPPLLPTAIRLPPAGREPRNEESEHPNRGQSETWPPNARPTQGRKRPEERGGQPPPRSPRGRRGPEEASLVHDVVLFHHFAPVSLELLNPSLLGLRGLYVALLQVPEHPDRSQRNAPLGGPQPEVPVSRPAQPPNRPHLPETSERRKDRVRTLLGTLLGAGRGGEPAVAWPALTFGPAAAVCPWKAVTVSAPPLARSAPRQTE